MSRTIKRELPRSKWHSKPSTWARHMVERIYRHLTNRYIYNNVVKQENEENLSIDLSKTRVRYWD